MLSYNKKIGLDQHGVPTNKENTEIVDLRMKWRDIADLVHDTRGASEPS